MPERSENRFRTLADAMPQIVWEANAEGLLTYTNQRWTDYSGSSDPSKWFDYVHPSDQGRVAEQWMDCVANGKRYESEFRLLRASDKTFRWHLVRAEPVREVKGEILTWYGTCTDITEQKTLQEEKTEAFNALREAEARLNQALVTSRIGFWDVELPGGKVSLSQQLIDDWGIDASKFDGNLEIPLSRIHPEDRPRVIAAIDSAISTNEPYYVIYRVVFDSKPPMWVEARGQTVKDKNGNVIKFSGTSLDISDRIRQQQEIEAKSAEFVALAELTPQLLFTSNAEGSITYYNEPFFEYTGMSFEQLKGWGWKPVLHPDHYEATLERWRYSIQTGEPYETEYMIKRHDGVYRWHLGRAHPVRDSHGAIIKWMGTNTDIHEQKEIASQFKLAKEAAEAANAAKSASLTTTFCAAALDEAGTVTLLGSGSPPVIQLSSSGDRTIALPGNFLGSGFDLKYSTSSFTSKPGEHLVLCTDGFLESTADSKSIMTQLAQIPNARRNIEIIEEVFVTSGNTRQFQDDQTMLVVYCRPATSPTN